MPVYFLDTSALVKRYVAEAGSEAVTGIVSNHNASVVIADITRAEFVSALARRAREGGISEEQRQALKSAFALHLVHEYLIAPLQPAHITAAYGLIAYLLAVVAPYSERGVWRAVTARNMDRRTRRRYQQWRRS